MYGIDTRTKHEFRNNGCIFFLSLSFFLNTSSQESAHLNENQRKSCYTAWVIQEQRFERVCKASQNVTSRKALDDTEGIRIKSEFSKEPHSRLAKRLIQSKAKSTFPRSGGSTVLPPSGPSRELKLISQWVKISVTRYDHTKGKVHNSNKWFLEQHDSADKKLIFIFKDSKCCRGKPMQVQ